MTNYAYQAYCGAPPLPSSLWLRWNLDPLLILALGLALVVALRRSPPDQIRRRCLIAGWAVASAAVLSPLCALSVSLFAARIGQHMILTTLAAPLVAFGLSVPERALWRNGPVAAAAFTLALWFWHSPGPYAATFEFATLYWTMHLTTFGAALWLWSAVLHAPPGRMVLAVAATVAAGVQMALLGAVIAFTPTPVYAPHWLTTAAWGLSPLADQQLGGAVMWLAAGVIFAAAITVPLGLALRERAPAH